MVKDLSTAVRRLIAAGIAGCLLMASTTALAHDPGLEHAAAKQLLAQQMEAWNRGDLEGALQSYCPSEDIVWVNRAGFSRGYAGFAKSMRSVFAGGAAKMGQLKIDLVDVQTFGDGTSLMVVRWAITRDSKRLMGGISSQLWADCEGRMRVIFEHGT